MKSVIQIRFYDGAADERLRFAVILAKTGGRWVFCKHRQRDTYEVPGGHREPGETILDAAKRELREETGAVDFTIEPICAYSVAEDAATPESFGMLYAAEIRSFEALHSEIESIWITDELPRRWTYPLIQPRLMEEARKRGWR